MYSTYGASIMILRRILWLSVPMSLCACASTGDIQTQYVGPRDGHIYGGTFNLGPASAGDPRLMDPRFYMDDDSTPRWLLMTQPYR
jgi:hypothetical protein